VKLRREKLQVVRVQGRVDVGVPSAVSCRPDQQVTRADGGVETTIDLVVGGPFGVVAAVLAPDPGRIALAVRADGIWSGNARMPWGDDAARVAGWTSRMVSVPEPDLVKVRAVVLLPGKPRVTVTEPFRWADVVAVTEFARYLASLPVQPVPPTRVAAVIEDESTWTDQKQDPNWLTSFTSPRG
jgi:hypothetical protein